MRETVKDERRMAVIVALERCYRKWADCKSQMVGTLYQGIVVSRYMLPLQLKIADLKYHPDYKHLDFSEAWRQAR